MIRGRLRPLTKKCHQWDVRQVLPIGGIFAECSTRHPSDNKFISLIEVEFLGNNREDKEDREFRVDRYDGVDGDNGVVIPSPYLPYLPYSPYLFQSSPSS